MPWSSIRRGFVLNFSVKEAADLLQKLSLEPKTKAHDAPDVTKKVYMLY